jgi:hypothetical protein
MTQKIKISWLDQDVSVLKLNPMEIINASAEWSANRPLDEPWLATTKPTSFSQKYFTIALSLDAFTKFKKKVRQEFIIECKKLLELCSLNEIEEIKKEEIEKGNPGDLYISDEGILRLIIPSRLVDKAKSFIIDAFTRVEGELVERLT